MRCTRMSETRVIRIDVRKDPHLLPCIDQHDRDSIGVSDIVPFLDPMVVPNFILADGLPSDQSLIPWKPAATAMWRDPLLMENRVSHGMSTMRGTTRGIPFRRCSVS